MINHIPSSASILRFVLILAGLLIAGILNSQNLVPNPGFEMNTGCPNNWGQINLTNSWSTPSQGSPDYYNTCATAPEFDVPLNISGYSNAHTGNGYVGIITWQDTFTFNSPRVVEYVQAQLTSPLVAGQCYRVSFWASCAEGTASLSQGDPVVVGMSSLISAYVSVTPPNANTLGFIPIPSAPQLTAPLTVNDTAQWTLVTAIFTAQGGEQYITIGNWDAILYGNGPPHSNGPFEPSMAYYFVDDVELTAIPQVNLGADDLICPGETITLSADPNASSWLWNTGETTSTIQITNSGTYWVQQTTGPCTSNDTIVILDDNCPTPVPPVPDCSFYVPNTFTPNGDTKNDVFGPKGETISEYHMMIFNRWGQMIFESYDFNQTWDGTYKGSKCEEDVYVYIVYYRCSLEYLNATGHVALIR